MESLLPFLQGTCTPYNMPVYPGAQRIIADTRSYIIEVQGKPTMVACLITFDLLAGGSFSGFPEWLAAFEARCNGRTAAAGAA